MTPPVFLFPALGPVLYERYLQASCPFAETLHWVQNRVLQQLLQFFECCSLEHVAIFEAETI
jgi:archaellum component FlaD/FlaE